jgi:hypothetical protein
MDVKKKGQPTELPALECDLLYGVAMIAAWLGVSRGVARHLIEDGTLPTFHPPRRSVRCALKAELNAAFQQWSKRERR